MGTQTQAAPVLLKEVPVARKVERGDFLHFIDKEKQGEFLSLAKKLAGRRVVHVSATPIGGGVAEIMQSLIPYLNALGVEASWYVIDSSATPAPFFAFTNKLHNALQGVEAEITDGDWEEYERVNEQIARQLEHIEADVLVVHDPQPLLAGSVTDSGVAKIYFSHIDSSLPDRTMWRRLLPMLDPYRRVIFSNSEFVNNELKGNKKVRVFTPAIDPLSPKQKIVPREEAKDYLSKHGMENHRPLIVQVSRFDVWKNPLGLIEAFRIVQTAHPEAQLALVGFNEAQDNPEAAAVYRDVAAVARGSEHIHLFFEPDGVDVVEFTMMAQNAADVIAQNSIREGFGLTVTEAMWKGKPVVGGPASGVRRQIVHGTNGYIAENASKLAILVAHLLHEPGERRRLGEAGRETVREKFLFPRLVHDHLREYSEALQIL